MMELSIQFIPIVVVGFAASLSLTPITKWLAVRFDLVDKPSEARKIHNGNIPLLGGLAIYTAFALAILLFSPPQHIRELAAILAGTGLLAAVGLADDRYNLGIGTRLIAMTAATIVLILAGIQVRLFNNPWIDIPITIIWVLAITNAINFLDNMDGLAAGLSAIGSVFFLLIAITQGQILVGTLAAALMGSSIGFLVYNFSPASTFMGDMGALTLGFVLAIIGIKLNFGAQPLNVTWMVPIFALAVPIFDINLVVFTRLMEGRSPGQAGTDHTSHRIMALGFSQRQTTLIIYGIAIFFGCIALAIATIDPTIALPLGISGLFLLGLLFIAMVWIREKYQKVHNKHE